jgi:hypothetical protein
MIATHRLLTRTLPNDFALQSGHGNVFFFKMADKIKDKRLSSPQSQTTICHVSKTKGQTFRYRCGNETKTFWYRSQICLVENRLYRFGPESALLDQIEMISLDGADSGTNSGVLVSFLLDVGTFVERLWNVCSFTVLTLLNYPFPPKFSTVTTFSFTFYQHFSGRISLKNHLLRRCALLVQPYLYRLHCTALIKKM